MCFMVERMNILDTVVGNIPVDRGPVEVELSLGFATAGPQELHVHRFDVLGDDGFVKNTDSGGVVGLDGSLVLWPTHFDE